MRIIISEKQLKKIIKKEIEDFETELSEDEGTTGSAYPEVGKWESGVSREGPANQIGLTKWSDTVGSKLSRGKANKLK